VRGSSNERQWMALVKSLPAPFCLANKKPSPPRRGMRHANTAKKEVSFIVIPAPQNGWSGKGQPLTKLKPSKVQRKPTQGRPGVDAHSLREGS